ncbi:MAG: di-heme oxidoredictase family protein [Candidatus Competibacteraceae bacterium]|jgi:CxxC motif-containing protein (DUF1111 family)|nr:di-heme oxidoredictase family protein [Candidatus Competibacteraceae bacterium]
MNLRILIFLCIALCAQPSAIADEKPIGSDFSCPEPGEEFPGGATTHTKKINKNAFSHASANMSFEREIDFKVGNGFFKRLWVSAPASTQAADGLGPLYNARSCQRCHLKDGRGHPPNGPEDNAVSMFLRVSIPPSNDAERTQLQEHKLSVIPEPNYGTQLQDFAISGHQAEGQMRINYEEIPVTLADGTVVSLRKPTYSVQSLGYGALHPETMLSPRVAPQMIGLGLLEAIPEYAILANADPDDQNQDGISGRPSQVWSLEHQRIMLGRFGWKAGAPSVNEQSQGAFAGDIGISVPLHPSGAGECTENQKDCQAAPNGNSKQYDNLEAHAEIVDLVVFYAKNLAVPRRRDHDAPDVLAGKKIFNEIGCAQCHQPRFMTQQDPNNPEQSAQLIWPYTDLLLHDMGEGLADGRPEGVANGQEWRTAPLWGIGLTPVVNGHSYYLHDGRARGLLEAILWHGGEAQQQRDAVTRLSKPERDQLIRFVESL